MRSHHSTWSPARAHGSMACHQDNKLEDSIQYSEERKTEQRGKEIEIDKKNLHLMFSFCLFYFSLKKNILDQFYRNTITESNSEQMDSLEGKVEPYIMFTILLHKGK